MEKTKVYKWMNKTYILYYCYLGKQKRWTRALRNWISDDLNDSTKIYQTLNERIEYTYFHLKKKEK